MKASISIQLLLYALAASLVLAISFLTVLSTVHAHVTPKLFSNGIQLLSPALVSKTISLMELFAQLVLRPSDFSQIQLLMGNVLAILVRNFNGALSVRPAVVKSIIF